MRKLRPMSPANVRLAMRVLNGETLRAVADDAGVNHARMAMIVRRACIRLFLPSELDLFGKPVETIADYRELWRKVWR